MNEEEQLIFDLGAHVGDKSHIFFNFSNYQNTEDYDSSFSVDLQNVSDDKYLKL